MLAAVFPSPGSCEIVRRKDPIPGEGEVLVQVKACGVCGTDVHIYRGQFPARFPLVAGHEFSGLVQAAGPNVTSVQPGDHVTIDPNITCGLCRPCRRGLTHLCRDLRGIGVVRDGGFATHCLAPARQVYRLPEEMSFETAALAEPVACCLHGIERADPRPGDVVVLIGAGVIGLLLLQLCLLRGAALTIVSELEPKKREAARALGAARVVDPRSEDLIEVVREVSDGSGADVVIEAVGGQETAQQAPELAAEGGQVLLFGVAPQEARIAVSPFDIYRREVTITGSFTNPYTHAAAIALLASGRLPVGDLVSHRLGLDGLTTAIELLESRQAMKVMITPQEL